MRYLSVPVKRYKSSDGSLVVVKNFRLRTKIDPEEKILGQLYDSDIFRLDKLSKRLYNDTKHVEAILESNDFYIFDAEVGSEFYYPTVAVANTLIR